MMKAIENEYNTVCFLVHAINSTVWSIITYSTSREKSVGVQLELGVSLPCVISTNTHLDPSPLRQWK